MKIYYFSGTGNAKKVANWICIQARSHNLDAEYIDITKTTPEELKFANDEILGFISPTHGFNFPPVMINFLLRFPKIQNSKEAFLINTRAGMKLKKIYFPGLSGIALLFAASILLYKGYRIKGMQSIDLPSNWISLHPGLTAGAIEEIFDRCKKKSVKFIEKIIEGKRSYKAFYDIIQDLLIAPIAVLYYCIGRFVFAKSFMASSLCDNCGVCINQCPVRAISLVNGRPFWSYKCESCMKCINNCPKRAIETAHGFIIGTIFLVNAVLITWLYNQLRKYSVDIIIGNSFLSGVIRFVIEPAILIFVLILSYRLLHYLKRFRFIDLIITYTSLTKFKFWRRYKAPRN